MCNEEKNVENISLTYFSIIYSIYINLNILSKLKLFTLDYHFLIHLNYLNIIKYLD